MTQHNEKGTRRDLVLYRLEVAKSDIKSAKILLDAGECRGANNRAYYGIYHAISAIHAFPKFLGRKIAEAEEIRHASDYDDFYIATREEVEEQIDTAVELVEKIEEYVLKEMG